MMMKTLDVEISSRLMVKKVSIDRERCVYTVGSART